MTKTDVEVLLDAAKNMDWEQAFLNQYAPCFFIEEDGSFCGRAKRWAGHKSFHKFRSLEELLRIWIACGECGGKGVLVNDGPQSVCGDCNGSGREPREE